MVGKVVLAGREFALEDLRAEPARFREWFEEARTNPGHAICQCVTPGRRLQVRPRNGLFHLAIWPRDRANHQSACDFSKTPDHLTGASGYTEKALKERDDGSVDIKADFSLKVRTADRNTPAEHKEHTSGGKRASMAMLGLLHNLWERARLNQWQPHWGRNWSRCTWELGNLEGKINRVPMHEALYIVPAFESEQKDKIGAGFEAFSSRLVDEGAYRMRGLVLGEVKGLSQTEYGYRLNIRHHAQAYYASKGLVQKVSTAARHAMAMMGNPNARIIALLVVERSKRGFLNIVDMAVMLTTRNYIPVDSSHELTMADALTAAGRAFIKPLLYDQVEDTFPDFRLTDVEPETLVEVYGMAGNAEYDLRKAAKQAIYRAEQRTVIEWDPREPMPSLKR